MPHKHESDRLLVRKLELTLKFTLVLTQIAYHLVLIYLFLRA